MQTRPFSLEYELENLLYFYVDVPNDPHLNLKMGTIYESMGQTAAAISFYLKAAEYGEQTNPDIAYTSLIKIGLCFESQGGRYHSVVKALQHAISYMPNRPEAYFILSRFYERNTKWQDSYLTACTGLLHTVGNHNPLPADVEYEGHHCLLFQKAVSGWWCSRQDDSVKLFKELLDNHNMSDTYLHACLNNLSRI